MFSFRELGNPKKIYELHVSGLKYKINLIQLFTLIPKKF